MRSLIVLATLAFVCSCGGQTEKKVESEDSVVTVTEEQPVIDSDSLICERVKEIYANGNQNVFSASFQALMEKVEKYDEGAELGYLDHDILTQAQDDVKILGISITDITETTAIAIVQTDYQPLTLKLVKEEGNWKVDNVNTEREEMTKYLAN